MSIKNGKKIEENEKYSFTLTEDKTKFMFSWKYIEGLSVEIFQKGITEFAAQCKVYKPSRVVIEAADLDQSSPAVAWLHGNHSETHVEDYMTWWTREIVPLYHDAGIVSLAVDTGDPNAPGELPQIPPEVKFRIGYFPNLEAAMQWNVG